MSRKSLYSVRFAGQASLAALALAVGAAPALADDVVNPGFETGDTTGWTASGGIWSSGTWPPPESEFSGPPTLLSMMTAGGFDAVTGAPTVFEGNYAVRLNDQFGGNHITALSQTVNNYNGSHLYYAWNAVLEPSHGATDSPSFIIKVIDETTNQVVTNIAYSAFTAQNTTIFRQAGQFVTTDWLVEDIDTVSGHNYRMVFVAVDCLYGGHGGYVYVDGFGNAIPIPNAGVDFDPTTDVVQGGDILLPIGGTPDIDTARPFYTTADLAAGLVNPVFVGGTLQVGNSGTIGNNFLVQALGGTVDNLGNVLDFTGQFTGPGGMIFTGSGRTILSNINTIDGAVQVNGGNLVVNGALSTLSLDVNTGATLSGQGAVVADVNVNTGGTLAPGDGVGTLNVAGGDVTMAAGSTLSLDIDGRAYVPTGGAGSYDRLIVSGGGNFVAGGTISPVLRGIAAPATNTFTPVLGDRFTVVQADAVSGEFASVAQPAAGLAANTRFDVLYGPQAINLVVTPGSYGLLGRTAGWRLNAVSAATGIDVVRPRAGLRNHAMMPFFNGIYGMTGPQLAMAFQQVSGEVHTHALQMAHASAGRATQTAMDAAQDTGSIGWGCGDGDGRVRSASSADADGGRRSDACVDGRTKNGLRIWGEVNANQTQAEDDATAYRYDNNERGFIMGVDKELASGTRIGLGGRYAESDLDTPIGSQAKLNAVGAFAYASHSFGNLNLAAVAGYSSTKVRAERELNLLTGLSTAHDSYRVNTLSGALEARYTVPVGQNAVLRPVAGIEVERSSAGTVQEVNANPALALALPSEKWTTVRSKLGAEARVGIGSRLQGKVFGNWRHTLDGNPTAVRAVNFGTAKWDVSSVVADKDNFEFGAGLTVGLSQNARIGVEYTGSRDGSYKVDSGSVNFTVRF